MTARLVKLVAARGLDPAAICSKAGVSLDEVSNPLARVPYRLADALLDACVDALGTQRFALELSRFADAETYDAAGLVLMTSGSFGEGLERAFAYQRLWADGERFSFERTRAGGVLRFQHPGPSSRARAILAELAFIETMTAARVLVAPEARPVAVRFTHPAATGDASELGEALGTKPTFGAAHNELALAQELVTAQVRAPEGAVAAMFDLLARRALAALSQVTSLAARLEVLLREDSFKLTLEAAAAYLRMPPRTLQRQLRSEGTSWTELVDAARRKRVRELELRALPEKEIAYLVGYSDPSALARARRRWA
jgi:AraC-like DNA-binding protein